MVLLSRHSEEPCSVPGGPFMVPGAVAAPQTQSASLGAPALTRHAAAQRDIFKWIDTTGPALRPLTGRLRNCLNQFFTERLLTIKSSSIPPHLGAVLLIYLLHTSKQGHTRLPT